MSVTDNVLQTDKSMFYGCLWPDSQVSVQSCEPTACHDLSVQVHLAIAPNRASMHVRYLGWAQQQVGHKLKNHDHSKPKGSSSHL